MTLGCRLFGFFPVVFLTKDAMKFELVSAMAMLLTFHLYIISAVTRKNRTDLISGDVNVPLIKRRVRRVTGSPTKCVTEFRKFCHTFVANGISKRFCIAVPMKYCTAVD